MKIKIQNENKVKYKVEIKRFTSDSGRDNHTH